MLAQENRSFTGFSRCELTEARAGLAEPSCVLLLVVLAVLAAFQRLPPVAVLAVPLDGRREPVRERALGLPTELTELAVESSA